MNSKSYILEIKQLIRNRIKDEDKKDFKKHIYIIKTTLFFISKVILLKLQNKHDVETEKALNSQSILHENFNSLFADIDVRRKYETTECLDKDIKLKLTTIIDKVEVESLYRFSLGELYDYFTTTNEKKLLGQVYTPKDIVKEMINMSFDARDIIINPYFKVVDPACGGGFFLLEAYDKIKKIIIENYDKIIMHDENTKEQLRLGIHEFILENNIWGTDIDDFAVYMTRFSLMIRGAVHKTNIFKSDSLLEDRYLKQETFDLVISNPPYIGHKKIDKKYRLSLSSVYGEVYSDKGDISYCFFKKGYELLKNNGNLSFITSRYFLESPSGKPLRRFIKKNTDIKNIIDFYGENVFKGVGISPVIINLNKSKDANNIINVSKKKNYKEVNSFRENLKLNFIEFLIEQQKLRDEGWILLSIEEMKLFDKINDLGEISLRQTCEFKQGIITGLDKAFIIDDIELKNSNYESDLIKPWIKNSHIDKFTLRQIKKYIIYTDKIKDEENYPFAIEKISKYKDKLSNRRECIKGIRKWYELQWGRKEAIFSDEKIVFPYKSDKNKFVRVREEICFSADIYFITIREEYKNTLCLEYLLAFLNSKICEFYFKCMAKKLNEKLYEYYPNKLENLKLILRHDTEHVRQLVIDIEKSLSEGQHREALIHQQKIDKYFYKVYGLNRYEIDLVESYFV